MCNSTWNQQAVLQAKKKNKKQNNLRILFVIPKPHRRLKKGFISLPFLSSFGKTLSEYQKLFLVQQLVLIEPYGEQSTDWLRGAWEAFPLKSCSVHGNEVGKQGKKRKGGSADHSYEQRVFRQQPHNVWAIHLKGFGVHATFSLSTNMKGTNVNA